MKRFKLLILTGWVFSLSLQVQAQNSLENVRFGVIGGYHSTSTSYSNLDSRFFESPKSVGSGAFGAYAELFLTDNFSIRPQIMFLSRGTKIDNVAYLTQYFRVPNKFQDYHSDTQYGSVTTSLNYKIDAKYTDIRLPFIYNFGENGGLRPYIYVAPILGLVRGGEIFLAGSGNEYSIDVTDANMASTYFAISPGIGLKIPVGGVELGLEASYEFGLTDTYSSKEKDGRSYANYLFPIYHIDGTRKFSGFEVSAHLSIPLSIFGGGSKKPVRRIAYIEDEPRVSQGSFYTLDDVVDRINRGKNVKGAVIRAIGQINFDTNKSNISSTSYAYLDRVANLIKLNGLSVDIKGHTDGQGSDAYNMELSKKRAIAVYNYLIRKGVSRSKLSYSYYGESQPIATNATEEGRRQNRRVEFEIK